MPETTGEEAEVKNEDVVAREDEVYDPETTWAEDKADDDITDEGDGRVKVEADAELLVKAARFIVYTGFTQRGSRDSMTCEEVLESASTLELSAVDVETYAEACEEEAVVGPE